MSEIVLSGDPRSFLNHFAAFGLAAILEEGLRRTCRVSQRSANSLVVSVDSETETPESMASVVKLHAERHLDSWIMRTHKHGDKTSGTMSPRLAQLKEVSEWRTLQAARWAAFDSAFEAKLSCLDLMYMGSLGEPAYWYIDNNGGNQPDRGASGWEMKTRNRGEEFVQHRLADLCRRVAARTPKGVLDGLTSIDPQDEAGNNSPSSRTPTGLSAPAATDNALAWCALWGISLFQVTHSAAIAVGTGKGSGRQSVTAGLVRGLPLPESLARAYAFLPIFPRPTRLARIKTIVGSGQLARVVIRHVLNATEPQWRPQDHQKWSRLSQSLSALPDEAWLKRKGCPAALIGYIKVSDNVNAPEPHVTRGTYLMFGSDGP